MIAIPTGAGRKQKPVRSIFVNGVEKYRVMVNHQLIYAKGKINFDFNWIKDGSGKSLAEYFTQWDFWVPSSIFVFYEEGFFKLYDKENVFDNYHYGNHPNGLFYKYEFTELSDIIPYWFKNNTIVPVTFKGWYTDPIDDSSINKINTMHQIESRTDLFKYKEKDELPEITLYAHWEFTKYKIIVHNIKNKKGTSSFIHYNEKTKKRERTSENVIDIFEVDYGTNIVSYINEKITSPKYITWAKDKLDNTNKKQELRAGPQQFLGWTDESKTNKHLLLWFSNQWIASGTEKIINVYPCFEILAIWPEVVLKSGKKVGGTFKVYDNNVNDLNITKIIFDSPPVNNPRGGWGSFTDYDPKTNSNKIYAWVVDKGDSGYDEAKHKSTLISSTTSHNNVYPYYSSTIVIKPKIIR